eukprot:762462-Hanusia_phi.AAC.7
MKQYSGCLILRYIRVILPHLILALHYGILIPTYTALNKDFLLGTPSSPTLQELHNQSLALTDAVDLGWTGSFFHRFLQITAVFTACMKPRLSPNYLFDHL